MFNILLSSLFIFLIIISIIRFKDVISPPVILSIIWTIPILFVTISEGISDKAYQFNIYAITVFFVGIVFFMIGFSIINRKISKNNNALILKTRLEPRWPLKIFMVCEIIIFLIFIVDVYIYVKSHFQYNFWFTYKWSTQEGYYQELFIMPITRCVSRFLLCLLFINLLIENTRKNKKFFIVQLIITICCNCVGQGRGAIFSFVIPLFIIYIIIKRKSLKQILKVLSIMSVLFIFIFVVYAKLKSPYQEQNKEFFFKKLENYTAGGLIAFCNWAENGNIQYKNGRCTFRLFYAIFNKMGADVEVEPLIEEYVENINGNIGNVYTFYHWYAKDFGLIYAVCMQLVIGMLHGILYKNTYQKRTHSWLIMHSLFYYPLIMQFFMDEYSTLLSLWLQYIVMLFIFCGNDYFFKRSLNENNIFGGEK